MLNKNSIFKDPVVVALLLMLTGFWFYYGGSIPFLDGAHNFLFQLMVLSGGLEQLTYAYPAGHPSANVVVAALLIIWSVYSAVGAMKDRMLFYLIRKVNLKVR